MSEAGYVKQETHDFAVRYAERMVKERKAYAQSIQIYVTDLQSLCDDLRRRLVVTDQEWARMQGALNGLHEAINRASEEETP